MNIRPISSFLSILIICLSAYGQEHGPSSLLVVEYGKDGQGQQTQNLVRYHFNNGELTGKESVTSTRTEFVRYDLDENRIYRNRYVITNWADVVDIQTGRVLHKGDGEFVGIEGDLVIERIDRVKLHGFFFYDLTKRRYARLESPGKWNLPGEMSPDQTKSAAGEMGSGDIWLHSLNGRKQKLGSGFWVNLDAIASTMPRAPVLFIDNDRVLTQKSNGKIVILRTDRTVEPVVKIPIKRLAWSLPEFYRDRNGKIIYECSGEAFIIDVDKKSYEPYDWVPLGYEFAGAMPADQDNAIIRHQRKEIGQWWCIPSQAKTTSGYIAFAYGPVGSNLGHSKGIKVWSGANSKWTTIDIDWLTTVIGWVKD